MLGGADPELTGSKSQDPLRSRDYGILCPPPLAAPLVSLLPVMLAEILTRAVRQMGFPRQKILMQATPVVAFESVSYTHLTLPTKA